MHQYKTCSGCGLTLELTHFNASKKSKDLLTGRCKECINAKKRAWAAANREKVSKINAKQYARNPNAYKSAAKKWKSDHPEKAYKSSRAYLQKNPGLANSYASRRRAKMAAGSLYVIRPKFLKRLYASACIYCGTLGRIEADHVIPISLGGFHSEGNLAPSCVSCNRSKHDDLLMVWRLKEKRGGNLQPPRPSAFFKD